MFYEIITTSTITFFLIIVGLVLGFILLKIQGD